MRDYFIRRLILIPPTLLGISIMVFAITRLAPGGPLEQAMMQMQQVSEEGGGGLSSGSDQALSEDQLEQMKRLYGFDKPHWEAYLIWLGVLPRETEFRQIRFLDNELQLAERVSLPSFSLVELDWNGDGYLQRQEVPEHLNKYIDFSRFDHNQDGEIDAIEADTPAARIKGVREKIVLQRDGQGGVRLENDLDLLGNWKVRMKERDPDSPNRIPVAELFMTRYEGVLQGNFGQSTRYGEPVLSVITERLPVSTYFGLLTFLITYIVCIPLGIFKAVRHNTLSDDISSILIFVGYSVPGYALGSLLLLFFSVKLDWLPMGGLTSSGFEELSAWEQVKDLAIHTFQPLCCYLIGGFAFVTMLMKNHLMDNLASDYVRTAMAKGVSFGVAVRKHALRNSLVPLATNVGHQVTLFVTGSFLIETIFDIDGFGLLGFNSVIDRDYPVVMGVLTLSATLMLIGNVLSDALVALVDPRVRFE
ncbi:ABC transporter permease [Opitutales bacterium]|jgi:microcin C transport system permease protein|nr:ABC transporter permease [Opitutales bacterium]